MKILIGVREDLLIFMKIINSLKAWMLLCISLKKNIDFDILQSTKVLMLRYDRIGDMVITTPVFRELKKKYPEIELSVLASKSNQIILKNNPYVDNIYLNNKNNIFFDIFVLLKLRRKQFDICIEFDHSVVRHAIIRLKIINPKKVISVNKNGRYGVDGNQLKIYDYYTEKPLGSHFRDIWLGTLKPLNVIPGSNKYEIYLDENQRKKASKFLSQYGDKVFIGVNLEGAVNGKKINFEDLKSICTGLYRLHNNVLFLIISSPSSENKIINNINEMKLNFVQKAYTTFNILDASALINSLDLIITPDTSIAHIASTFNKPVITIHEDNHDSHKLFAPTSDINKTVFSKDSKSLIGFSIEDLISKASEILRTLDKGKK